MAKNHEDSHLFHIEYKKGCAKCEVVKLRKEGTPITEIAKKYGLSKNTVYQYIEMAA